MTLLLAGVAGCAGYRSGWKSVAYFGETPPAADSSSNASSSPGSRSLLKAPGLQLEIALDNQLRTSDTQVYLFAVPLSVDASKAYDKNIQPGKTRLFVTVTPSDPGFVFRPNEAVLVIGDERIPGAAGYEFGKWSGTWDHRPVGQELALTETGRPYYLSIDFDTPVPSPQSPAIAVDLSRALASPQQPPLPLIRFAPTRWKEGYT
jgi:hypothetical protein